MGYKPNEALTLYLIGGYDVRYREVLVYSSGPGRLVLADKKSSENLHIAYDPSNPYQDHRQLVERTRSKSETVQRAKEIWGLRRYNVLLNRYQSMLRDATTGEGVNRTYPNMYFDEDDPPKSFEEYWREKLNLPNEPDVLDVTGTPIGYSERPIK